MVLVFCVLLPNLYRVLAAGVANVIPVRADRADRPGHRDTGGGSGPADLHAAPDPL